MSDLNEKLCPYCFSKFSEVKWTDDPLLVKNGSQFFYHNPSGLLIPYEKIEDRLYKGFTVIKNKHITELQDANYDNRPEAGWTPVEGEPDSIWIPNKTHIKELRDAVERGLGITEETSIEDRTTVLEQYFNYDEDGIERQNPHQLDWTDPNFISSTWKNNIPHMHIEDLRKVFLPPEMYLLNNGEYTLQSYILEEADICYEQWQSMRMLARRQITYWWQTWLSEYKYWTDFDGDGRSWWIDPEPPNGWYLYKGIWYPIKTTELYPPPEITGAGRVHRAYKKNTGYYGHKNSITCIPTLLNLNIVKYEIQELVCEPLLVDETDGYPCQQYAGDSWHYAVPKIKSVQYLEDILEASGEGLGLNYNMNKLEYDDTAIFKLLDMTTSAQLSNIYEPAFDTRRMENNSWGVSNPPAWIMATSGLWNGVGRVGTSQCGNCSIYIPKTWNRDNIIKYRKNTELAWTFGAGEEGTVYYVPPRQHWTIDLRNQDLVIPFYDPSTENYRSIRLGRDCILAKRDDTKNVKGTIIAQHDGSFNTTVYPSTTEINLPANCIVRSVDLQIGENIWKKVNSLEEYTEIDKVFIIEDNKIKFGIYSGFNIVDTPTNAEIACYTDELIPDKIYPNGYIVFPYNEVLKDITVYVYIEYYNAPYNYHPFYNPETLYEVSYISKPPLGTLSAGDTSGIILSLIIPEPTIKLLG